MSSDQHSRKDPREAELEFLAFLDDQTGPLSISPDSPDQSGLSTGRFCDMVFHLILENCVGGCDHTGYQDMSVKDPLTQLWLQSSVTVGKIQQRQFPFSIQITHAGRLRLSRLREELDRGRILDQTGILVDGRYIDRDLRVRFAMASPGAPLAVMIADLDHFKQVNDTLGHPRGDEALRIYFTVLRDIVGACAGDAYRKGGDETVAILPGADLIRATEIAEKLRATIESEFSSFDAKLKTPPTVSLGVESFTQRVSSAEALKKVDELLYKAKQDGRNRVASGGT